MTDLKVSNGRTLKPDLIVKLRPDEAIKAQVAGENNGEENVFFRQGTDTYVASQRARTGPAAGGPALQPGTQLEFNGAPAKVLSIKGPPLGFKVGTAGIGLVGLAGAFVGFCGALASLSFVGIPLGLAIFVGFCAMTVLGAYTVSKADDFASTLNLGGAPRPNVMKAFGEVVS